MLLWTGSDPHAFYISRIANAARIKNEGDKGFALPPCCNKSDIVVELKERRAQNKRTEQGKEIRKRMEQQT